VSGLMNNKHPKSAKQWLDHRSDQLGKKHFSALDYMTDQALMPKQKIHFFMQYKAVMAIAFSVLLVMGIMFNVNNQSLVNTEPKMATLPAWVSDTQVPVPVIEQLKFYTWLAQQLEDNNETLHAISKNQATKIDVAWIFKFGSRQQLASLDAP